jgi:multiple sugar transport system substrate-binding protein
MAPAGQTFLTKDHKINFNSDATVEALLKMRDLVNTKALLSGAPQDWWDPSAFNQGLCAMTRQGLWAQPAIEKALGDDFGVFPTPAVGSSGKPAIFLGGWTQFVSAKSKNIDAAKQYIKWLWLEKTDLQEDWALSYGFHIPPRQSLAKKASKLQKGVAAEVLDLTTKYGWTADPFWTQSMGTAFKEMAANVVIKGADPKAELATCVSKVETELKKLA